MKKSKKEFYGPLKVTTEELYGMAEGIAESYEEGDVLKIHKFLKKIDMCYYYDIMLGLEHYYTVNGNEKDAEKITMEIFQTYFLIERDKVSKKYGFKTLY